MCVTTQKPTPGNFQCQAFHGLKSSAILFEPSTEPILNNTILFPGDYARIHELEQSMNYKCNMQYIYIEIDIDMYTHLVMCTYK